MNAEDKRLRHNAANKRYYHRHREVILARRPPYDPAKYQANREYLIAKQIRWNRINRDKSGMATSE